MSLRLQAASLLAMLLRAAPEHVTRKEIRDALWEEHTGVDVEGALNAVVRELRAALGDTADEQRFIETLPKRGYRFCHDLTDTEPARRSGRGRWAAGVFIAMLGTLAFGYLAGVGHPAPDPVRLAVLPAVQLDTTGSGPSIAYRATAKLLSGLRGIAPEQLVVVGSENVRRFGAESVLDTAGVAADFFLETDAVQDGDALDVVATLRNRNDANEDRRFERVYSQATVRRDLEDVVQQDLLRWICEELSIAGVGGRVDADWATPDTIDTLIRARWLREQDAFDRQLEALTLYESILEDQPQNAEAQAGKLKVLLRVVDHFGPRRRQLMDDIEALSLGLSGGRVGSGGLADLGIAFIRLHRDWDLEGARRHAETAVALDPRSAQAHAVYSSVRAASGDLLGAINSAEIALRISPDRWARIDLCFYLVLSGDYERGREFCGWGQQAFPTGVFFGIQEALAILKLGDERQAVNRMIDLVRLGDPVAADRLREEQPSWRELGCRRAEALAGRARDEGIAQTSIPLTSIAHYWAQCGNKKELLLWMQHAVDARELSVAFYRFDPRFDGWQSDPDFQAVLAQVFGRLSPR